MQNETPNVPNRDTPDPAALEDLIKASLRALIGKPYDAAPVEIREVFDRAAGGLVNTEGISDAWVQAWWTAMCRDVAVYEALDLPFAPDVFEALSKWPTPPRDLPPRHAKSQVAGTITAWWDDLTTPLPPEGPVKNRAQRRLRPGKRPPDTSAKNAGPAWRGGGR